MAFKRVSTVVVAALTLLSGVAQAGCSGPVWNMRCPSIRSLRIGMSENDVESILGRPASRSRQDSSTASVRKTTDLVWRYSSNRPVDGLRGLRFSVEFARGRLVYVSSYRRGWYDDKIEDVFTLDEHGAKEGPEFSRWFCP